MSNNSPPESESGESVTLLGDFSKKLVANTLFNFLGRFWGFFATLLLTPYILRHLSVGEFGIWVIFSIFASSISLLDLGLGSAFVKFISAFDAVGDNDSINRVLFSGLLFYCLQGLLVLGVGLAAQDLLFQWFAISGRSEVYLLALAACAVGNLGTMFLSVFRGIQRMDKSNAIEIGMTFFNVIGTVIVLRAGLGLRGLALNALVNALVCLAISWRAVRQAVPRISHGPTFDGKLLREMFRYGAQIVVSRIGGFVCFQLPNLLIARFLGVAAVPFYEVSARLAASIRAVPLLMMSALIPATSELSARNEKDKIARTYVIASKYVALMTIGLVSFAVLEAGVVLRLWLGSGFEQSVFLVQILAIGYGVNVLGGPASQTGAGIGKPEFDMRSTLLLTAASPVLGFVLVPHYGLVGAAVGTSVALIAATMYLLFTFHRNYLQTSVEGMFREIHLRPAAAGAIAVLAVFAFDHFVPPVGWLESRYRLSAKLAMDFSVFSSVYLTFLIVLRQVTAIDRRNLLSLVTFGFEFVRHPLRERVKIYR